MYNLYRVNLLHILLIGPLLTYIGYYKKDSNYGLKLALGGIVLMIPFVVRLPDLNNLKNKVHLSNLLHWTLILVFLGYISYKFYNNEDIHYQIYNILFVTGIIVIITHIYLIYDKYNQINNKKVKLNK